MAFIFSCIDLNAQQLLPFVGGAYSIDAEVHGFLNVNAGVELSFKKYLKPEISLEYFFGSCDDIETYDDDGNLTTLFKGK